MHRNRRKKTKTSINRRANPVRFFFICITRNVWAFIYTARSSPSQANDTGSHQLLDLHPHLGVLHVLLQSGRVALGLLQNALHDRVLEDGHDL